MAQEMGQQGECAANIHSEKVAFVFALAVQPWRMKNKTGLSETPVSPLQNVMFYVSKCFNDSCQRTAGIKAT